jgi:hypothetical protein
MTDLRLELFFPWDRFTLVFVIGVSLLLAGLIEMVRITRWQTVVLVGLLVGLAAGLHFRSALVYRKEWLSVRDFFWQLTWRAPAIQPGTILLTTELPFHWTTSHALNWTYASDLASPVTCCQRRVAPSAGVTGLRR